MQRATRAMCWINAQKTPEKLNEFTFVVCLDVVIAGNKFGVQLEQTQA